MERSYSAEVTLRVFVTVKHDDECTIASLRDSIRKAAHERMNRALAMDTTSLPLDVKKVSEEEA